MLEIVADRPGITVREIGVLLGVDPTGLYRVAKRLVAAGRLRKEGIRLYYGAPPIVGPRGDDA